MAQEFTKDQENLLRKVSGKSLDYMHELIKASGSFEEHNALTVMLSCITGQMAVVLSNGHEEQLEQVMKTISENIVSNARHIIKTMDDE